MDGVRRAVLPELEHRLGEVGELLADLRQLIAQKLNLLISRDAWWLESTTAGVA